MPRVGQTLKVVIIIEARAVPIDPLIMPLFEGAETEVFASLKVDPLSV